MCTHTHTHTHTHIYTHSCATSCKVISLVPRWAPPHQAQVRSNETCTCGKIPFRPAYVKRDCMCEKRRVFSHIQVSFDIVGVIPPSPGMLTEVSLHLFWQVLLTGLLQVSCTGLFSRIHVSGRPANPVYVNRDCVWQQTCFSIYTGLFWHCMRHPTEPVYPQMSNETSIPVSTYASLSSIVRHVCLYVYKTGMSVLVQDRYVCLYLYKTGMSVSTYTRQVCLSLPIQDRYVCLYIYKSLNILYSRQSRASTSFWKVVFHICKFRLTCGGKYKFLLTCVGVADSIWKHLSTVTGATMSTDYTHPQRVRHTLVRREFLHFFRRSIGLFRRSIGFCRSVGLICWSFSLMCR